MFKKIKFILLLCMSMQVQAQYDHVDLNDFMVEIQKMSDSTDAMKMVWWLPTEYWQVVGANDSTMTEDMVQEVVDLVENYLIVAVVDGHISPFGSVSYVSEESIRKGVSVKSFTGESYFPIDAAKIHPDMKILFQSMKPIFESMIGEMGANFHFLVFDAKAKDGQMLAHPIKKGGFSVVLSDETFTWELPLSSMVKQKTCPVDGKKLNGTWTYCPWHGTKLTQ